MARRGAKILTGMSSKAARPVFCIYIYYDICHTGLTAFGLYVFILIIVQCLSQPVPANVTSHSLWTGLLVRAASLRPTSSLVHSRYVVNVRLFHLVDVKDVRKRESRCQNSQTLLGEPRPHLSGVQLHIPSLTYGAGGSDVKCDDGRVSSDSSSVPQP